MSTVLTAFLGLLTELDSSPAQACAAHRSALGLLRRWALQPDQEGYVLVRDKVITV